MKKGGEETDIKKKKKKESQYWCRAGQGTTSLGNRNDCLRGKENRNIPAEGKNLVKWGKRPITKSPLK